MATLSARFFVSAMRFVVLLFAFLCGVSQAASTNQADTQELATVLRKVASFRANFIQTTLGANGRQVRNQRGTLSVERPYRFRWSVTDPLPLLIVCDGEDVYVYDEDLAQVTISELDTRQLDTPIVLLSGDPDKLGASFSVVKEVGNKADYYHLRPLLEASPYRKIKLTFVGKQLSEIEMQDSFGQFSVVQFINPTTNPTLDPMQFYFTIPDDVDIFRNDLPR